MQNWSGTARKLAIGFGALVVTIAVASFLTLAGLARIHRATEVTKHEEEGVRRALELASAVRDQYAHQAHTIIIGDQSHLGFYAKAGRHVLDLTRELRPFARGPDECGWMDDLEQASAEERRRRRGGVHAEAPAARREGAMTNPRVLVVDDKENMLKLFAKILAGGYEVTTCTDGARALALVATERFDVVVTDIRMPGADGFEVLRAVKARSAATEVVMMTGYGTIADAVQAMKGGAYDYLEKPFDPDGGRGRYRAVTSGGRASLPPGDVRARSSTGARLEYRREDRAAASTTE